MVELYMCRVWVASPYNQTYHRSVLSQLRWCELASDVTFGALWMPMGRFDNVSVHHVLSRPLTGQY